MRYLVTGGLGFVGNELVRQLMHDGDVTVVDNRNREAPDIGDLAHVPVLEVDITDANATMAAFEKVRPDVVFHLAAIHFIPECNASPDRTLRVNTEGTLSVLRASEAAGARKVVAASTGAVYADSSELLRESSIAEPVDIYGHSKLMAETLGRWFQHDSNISLVMVRLFNVYGPRETNAHIIPEIISQLRHSDVVTLGNTAPRRDFIFTEDVAQGFARLARADTPGYIHTNLASGHHASVDELILRIGRILGRPLQVEHEAARYRKADKLVQVADVSLLRQLTSWTPQFDLEAGLRKLLEHEGLV